MEKPLIELNPEIDDDGPGPSVGLWFDCPVCPSGHQIYVPWSGTSPFTSGALWKLHGSTSFSEITLHPSINCDVKPTYPGDWSEERKAAVEAARCKFHGHVIGGKVTW